MLVEFIKVSIEIIWPLYYSVRKINQCEEEKFPGLIKYWSLRIFMWIIEKQLSLIINEGLHTVIVLSQSIMLVSNKFAVSEWIFDKIVMELALMNWKYISGFFDYLETKTSTFRDNLKAQVGQRLNFEFLPGIKNFILGVLTGTSNQAAPPPNYIPQSNNSKQLDKSDNKRRKPKVQ